MRLSVKDMQRLATTSSAGSRAEVGGKIAATYAAGAFNEKEQIIAAEILRLLARDTEVNVRAAIAANLRDSMSVPQGLIANLARDVDEVSIPLLQYSYAITEEELIEIVRATREVAKLLAVAKRDTISADLSDALMDSDITEVLHTLFSNKNAQLRDTSLLSRWERLSGEAMLLEALVHRGGLSISVAEKLYSAVADELKVVLNQKYKLPMLLVDVAADEAREWKTLALSGEGPNAPPEAEVEKLVEQLFINNRLTYSLVMRALCSGDMAFFETAMARLAGVARQTARLLMFDSGPLGFKAFYEKAHLPAGFYEAVNILLRISLEETSYGRLKREDFRGRVVSRIMSEGYDRSVENMHYLLTIIGGRVASSENAG